MRQQNDRALECRRKAHNAGESIAIGRTRELIGLAELKYITRSRQVRERLIPRILRTGQLQQSYDASITPRTGMWISEVTKKREPSCDVKLS